MSTHFRDILSEIKIRHYDVKISAQTGFGKIKNPPEGINSRATAKCDSPWKAELSVTVDADALLVLCELLEFNLTVGKSKQSVVGTAADILAGMDVRTALSDNDIAGGYALTVRFFHTEALCLAVTSVLGGTDTLLMCKKLQAEL